MGHQFIDFAFFQVDAFTDVPFRGNPAAVVLLEAAQDPAWMQAVAAEMNLSETAFVVPNGNGFDLRWFTPAVEVDLCGHATLATAHVLWTHAGHQGDAIFATRSGTLIARQHDGLIWLDFPASEIIPLDSVPDGVEAAIGVPVVRASRARFDLLVEVESAATVKALNPDQALLRTIETRGIIVTAAGEDVDFVSRFFAPSVGVPEDPVTGSSHCALVPYWQEKLGKDSFTARQLSARGGVLSLRRHGDRVLIGGTAITVVSGSLVRS